MLGIRCRGVPVRESVCLFWRETHKKSLRTSSRIRPEGQGKEGPRRRQRELVDNGEQKKAVRRWKQGKEGRRIEFRKTTAKTCWPTEAGLTNARRQVSIASGFVGVFARVHARVSSQNGQKVLQNFLFLALGANPGPCLSVYSFLPPSQLCFAYL